MLKMVVHAAEDASPRPPRLSACLRAAVVAAACGGTVGARGTRQMHLDDGGRGGRGSMRKIQFERNLRDPAAPRIEC